MTKIEHALLALVARSTDARRVLQRWAMRYCAKLLYRLGADHRASAELLMTLGTNDSGGNTMTGRPTPRPPARVRSQSVIVPLPVRRIPERNGAR